MDKAKLKKIVNIVNAMSYSVNLFIGKTILARGFRDGKYANRYEVLPMEVRFYLYNTETQTTACKSYSFEYFCDICSDEETMKYEFSELAEKLMDRTSQVSKEIIYIERGIII